MVGTALQCTCNSPRWHDRTLFRLPTPLTKPGNCDSIQLHPISTEASLEEFFFFLRRKTTWMWWCKNTVKRLWPETIKCTHFFLYCLRASKIILECLLWLPAQPFIWKELGSGSEQVTIEIVDPTGFCPPLHSWRLASLMLTFDHHPLLFIENARSGEIFPGLPVTRSRLY